jgi:hypothetical protein
MRQPRMQKAAEAIFLSHGDHTPACVIEPVVPQLSLTIPEAAEDIMTVWMLWGHERMQPRHQQT